MSKFLIVIILILILIVFNFKREEFSGVTTKCIVGSKVKDSFKKPNCCFLHTIVDNDYDSKLGLGPTCLNTCIVEHVPKINCFDTSIKDTLKERQNILQYNRENPSEGFCHELNKKNVSGINTEIDKDKCNNSDKCIVKNGECQENKLNYFSNASILNKSKCSKADSTGCINIYMKNINTIKGIYDNYKKKTAVADSKKCISS